jgi:hypothetical protein
MASKKEIGVAEPSMVAGLSDVSPPTPEADEKQLATVSGSPTDDESIGIKDFPLWWKITALVLGLALSWGSSFSENTLGPLKATLIRELGINNAQVRIQEQYFTIGNPS